MILSTFFRQIKTKILVKQSRTISDDSLRARATFGPCSSHAAHVQLVLIKKSKHEVSENENYSKYFVLCLILTTKWIFTRVPNISTLKSNAIVPVETPQSAWISSLVGSTYGLLHKPKLVAIKLEIIASKCFLELFFTICLHLQLRERRGIFAIQVTRQKGKIFVLFEWFDVKTVECSVDICMLFL